MKTYRHFIFFVLFLLTLKSYANCQIVNGWNSRHLAFNFPAQFIVPDSLPVGSIFYETKVSENHNGEKYAKCRAGSTQGVKYLNGWVTDGNGIAATNVPGVGIRIHWLGGTSVLVPKDPYETLNHDADISWNPGPEWQVELIKTGAMSGGTLQMGGYAVYGIGNYYVSELHVTGGGKIVMPTCTVMSTIINVPLGRRLKSEFSGLGSTTPWQATNIPLNCAKGAKISVRIEANADPSGVPGVMTLDSPQEGGVATGVGIQLSFQHSNERAVVFGRNMYYYTSPHGGYELVQLQARYYQTGSQVVPGTANGTATFTITYD